MRKMQSAWRQQINTLFLANGKNGEHDLDKIAETTFLSVEQVREAITQNQHKSEYSDENKSNYKGSLLTRLESLTNGINSMIFRAYETFSVK